MDGRASTPLFAPVGLWHSWYAGAVLIVFSFVGAFAAVNSDGRLMVDGQLDSSAVFRMAAWGTGFGLFCMVFVARLLWRRALVGDAAMWRATWSRIVGAWAVLIVIGVLIGLFNHAVGFDVDTDQTKMVRALAGAGHSMGQWAVLVVVALLAPIFEELVFRGALLGGLSRHVSFGWANVWQAALFAAIHGDPPRLPYYFAMGLFGGWLVKRTGSLAPAIALHMLNNAVAMGMMLAFTA
jgi:membrane protease YdiL (CAAX protease family)